MNKKMPEYDVTVLRNRAVEAMHKSLDLSNKIEHGVVRLIITLSSSGLVLTIAMVEKLFSSVENTNLPTFLIISWILFFVSIIFGIVTEINESIFFANKAHEDMNTIEICENKISQGIFKDTFSADLKAGKIEVSSIGWEIICVNSFILAIVFMCFALLSGMFSTITACILIIIIFILLLVLNIHLLNKRENRK